jgi:hypothetical protein
VRELERKLPAGHRHAELLKLCARVLAQKRHDTQKVYSLHEPHVYCLAKGKAHKEYEFGAKAALAVGKNHGVILGESILLNGRPHTVVGVMPEHFRHPYSADVWLPLAMRFEPGTIRNRYLDGLARLRPGVTLASADAALRQICADVNGAAPDNYNAKRA